MWTEAVSGKKKLWIQKYPDMFGRDLSCNKLYHKLEVRIFCMLPALTVARATTVTCTNPFLKKGSGSLKRVFWLNYR